MNTMFSQLPREFLVIIIFSTYLNKTDVNISFAEILLLSGFLHTTTYHLFICSRPSETDLDAFIRWLLKTILSEQEQLFLCSLWNQKPLLAPLKVLLKMYLFPLTVRYVFKEKSMCLGRWKKGRILQAIADKGRGVFSCPNRFQQSYFSRRKRMDGNQLLHGVCISKISCNGSFAESLHT